MVKAGAFLARSVGRMLDSLDTVLSRADFWEESGLLCLLFITSGVLLLLASLVTLRR